VAAAELRLAGLSPFEIARVLTIAVQEHPARAEYDTPSLLTRELRSQTITKLILRWMAGERTPRISCRRRGSPSRPDVSRRSRAISRSSLGRPARLASKVPTPRCIGRWPKALHFPSPRSGNQRGADTSKGRIARTCHVHTRRSTSSTRRSKTPP
jgi:hypothetical protein